MKKITTEQALRARLRYLLEYKIGSLYMGEDQAAPSTDDDLLDAYMLDEDDLEPGEQKPAAAAPEGAAPEGAAPEGAAPAAEKKPAPAAEKKPVPSGSDSDAVEAPVDTAPVDTAPVATAPVDTAPASGDTAPVATATDQMAIQQFVSKQEDTLRQMQDFMQQMNKEIQQISQQVGQAGQVSQQIDAVKQEVEAIKPPTQQQIYDNIALQSYPYHLKLTDVFKSFFDKQEKLQNPQPEHSFTPEQAVQSFSDQAVEASLLGKDRHTGQGPRFGRR